MTDDAKRIRGDSVEITVGGERLQFAGVRDFVVNHEPLATDAKRYAGGTIMFEVMCPPSWEVAAGIAAAALPFGGRLEHSEPLYPELSLRAWAHVLNAWPKAGPRPRVDIIPVANGYDGPQGTYEPRRHAITIYPRIGATSRADAKLDRADAISTIIHEFAHAWAPHRARSSKHGKSWRDMYAELAGWVCGGVLDVDDAIAKYTALRDSGDPFCCDLFQRRRGNDLKSAIVDFAVTAAVHEHEPRVTMWDRDFKIIRNDGAIVHVVPYAR